MNGAQHSQLLEIREKILARDRAQRQLAVVEQALARQKSRLVELEEQVQKEDRDVQNLEHLSLSGLFATILGSKEEQLDQQRQESLAAHLKYEQVRHSVSALEEEAAGLTRQLGDLHGVDQQYQSLLQLQEQALIRENSPLSRRLDELTSQLSQTNQQKKELQEALDAARAARSVLQQILNSLDSAHNWGTWDMLGGGLLVSMAKHSRIDDARGSINELQPLLERLKRELADVDLSAREAEMIEIGGFETFADYFFDGLIVDWVVQGKIEDSQNRAAELSDKLKRLERQLEQSLQNSEQESSRLQAERQGLIENSISG